MDDARFDELMQKPYRMWIDHYLTTREFPELERELGDMIGGLPDVVYDCMPSFMDAAMRFLVAEPRSWDLPGTKIAALISLVADEKIPAVAEFNADERDTLYGTLFDVVTVFFATQAAGSEELRGLVGL
ncbi:MAG: hypothetical protein ACYC7J_04590 [Syntrophales bacterium]